MLSTHPAAPPLTVTVGPCQVVVATRLADANPLVARSRESAHRLLAQRQQGHDM
ncbi:hypothetical protein [Streptomyces sp. NPDC057340]|uniref:hypothetical protein n=1 Tax=Streptomyces sp. NPDC057340 TaxID=3346103 RepID=UPI0036415425